MRRDLVKKMESNEEFLEIEDHFETDHTGTEHLELNYSTLTYDFDFEYDYVPYYEYE